jgi:hypothetical protein
MKSIVLRLLLRCKRFLFVARYCNWLHDHGYRAIYERDRWQVRPCKHCQRVKERNAMESGGSAFQPDARQQKC